MKKRISVRRFLGFIPYAIFVFTIVGCFFGGIYFYFFGWLTKKRDPWLTCLLAGGLATTVFGLGHGGQMSIVSMSWVFVVSLILLMLQRWDRGSLGHHVERFGQVHAFAVMILFFTWKFQQLSHQRREKATPQQMHTIRVESEKEN